jgi:hypothetical protein
VGGGVLELLREAGAGGVERRGLGRRRPAAASGAAPVTRAKLGLGPAGRRFVKRTRAASGRGHRTLANR